MIFSGTTKWQRIILGGLAIGLAASGLSGVLLAPKASAYGLTSDRSITLSDSRPNASGVSYTVQFTPSGSTPIGGIVVDFCSNSPDTGQACNPPTDFSVSAAPVVNGYSGSMGSGWSAQAGNSFNSGSGYRTLILTNASPIASSNLTALSFTLTNASNPNSQGTFYARIFTYSTAAGATGYTSDSTGQTPGTFVDEGSVAISTGNNINVDFEVQESLTFCVFTNGATSCSAAMGNGVNLGDSHGVLSSNGPYVDKSIGYIVASNAVGGVGIYLSGNTLKDSRGDSITAADPANTSQTGTSQFGVCTYRSSASPGTTLVPFGNYGGTANGGTACSDANLSQTAGTGTPGGVGSNVDWYFNATAASFGYGDEIAQLPAPDTTNIGILALMANVSKAQTAGIYSTTLSLIATATY